MTTPSFQLDVSSGLVTFAAELTPAEVERRLAPHGFTLGMDTSALPHPFLDYAARRRVLAPFARGDAYDLLAGLVWEGPNGRLEHSAPSPRTAAGPDLKALLLGLDPLRARVRGITWRVWESADTTWRLEARGEWREVLLAAFRKELHARHVPTWFRLWPEGTGARLVCAFVGSAHDAAFHAQYLADRLRALGNVQVSLTESSGDLAPEPLWSGNPAPLLHVLASATATAAVHRVFAGTPRCLSFLYPFYGVVSVNLQEDASLLDRLGELKKWDVVPLAEPGGPYSEAPHPLLTSLEGVC